MIAVKGMEFLDILPATRVNPLRSENGSTLRPPRTVDAAIRPSTIRAGWLPILVEAGSAGAFTYASKRRIEEVTKVNPLREALGEGVEFG
jgi:hypothetical protein